MTQSSNMTAYLAQLTPMEQMVLQIAASHLETSFNLVKSIGYQEWLTAKQKAPSKLAEQPQAPSKLAEPAQAPSKPAEPVQAPAEQAPSKLAEPAQAPAEQALEKPIKKKTRFIIKSKAPVAI